LQFLIFKLFVQGGVAMIPWPITISWV